MVKWYEIKAEFEETFTKINGPCGFCEYCIERTEDVKLYHRCTLCKKEFPKVYRICKEMVDFFNAEHGQLDKMIDAIIAVIRAKK